MKPIKFYNKVLAILGITFSTCIHASLDRSEKSTYQLSNNSDGYFYQHASRPTRAFQFLNFNNKPGELLIQNNPAHINHEGLNQLSNLPSLGGLKPQCITHLKVSNFNIIHARIFDTFPELMSLEINMAYRSSAESVSLIFNDHPSTIRQVTFIKQLTLKNTNALLKNIELKNPYLQINDVFPQLESLTVDTSYFPISPVDTSYLPISPYEGSILPQTLRELNVKGPIFFSHFLEKPTQLKNLVRLEKISITYAKEHSEEITKIQTILKNSYPQFVPESLKKIEFNGEKFAFTSLGNQVLEFKLINDARGYYNPNDKDASPWIVPALKPWDQLTSLIVHAPPQGAYISNLKMVTEMATVKRLTLMNFDSISTSVLKDLTNLETLEIRFENQGLSTLGKQPYSDHALTTPDIPLKITTLILKKAMIRGYKSCKFDPLQGKFLTLFPNVTHFLIADTILSYKWDDCNAVPENTKKLGIANCVNTANFLMGNKFLHLNSLEELDVSGGNYCDEQEMKQLKSYFQTSGVNKLPPLLASIMIDGEKIILGCNSDVNRND